MGDPPATVSVKSPGVELRREGLRERLYGLARWGLVGGVAAIPLVAALGPSMAWLITALLCAVPALWAAWLLLPLASWRGPARVRVEGDSLSISEKKRTRVVPLSSLKAGWVGQQPSLTLDPSTGQPLVSAVQHRVELEKQNGDVIEVDVASAREGRRLLRAAGLDARRRSLRLQLGPTDFLSALFSFASLSMASLPVVLARGANLPWWVGLYGGLAAFLLLRRLFEAFVEPAFLTIGADGVLIEQSLTRVFVSFRDVVSWEVDEASSKVVFRTRDGRTLRARARHLGLGRGAQVRDRLEQAFKVFQKSDAAEDEAKAALQRGEQSVERWRQALAGVLDEGYRSAAVTREQLWALLQDPQEDAETRLGAALALQGSEGDGEARQRIRVVASACAAPRLRVALSSAAEGSLDDRALEEALLEESEAAERAG